MSERKKNAKRKAHVSRNQCVACGTCVKECPRGAIKIVSGVFAQVNLDQCVGCGLCEKACPASVIELINLAEVV